MHRLGWWERAAVAHSAGARIRDGPVANSHETASKERGMCGALPSCEGVARARAPCYEVQMYSNPGLTPSGLDKLDG